MPVPPYHRLIEPTLRYLGAHPDGAPAARVHEAVAEALGLTDADKAELLPSGIQPVYKNRAGWAHDRLKRAGLSSSPRRGYWQLTAEGVDFLAKHQAPLSDDDVANIASNYTSVVLGGTTDQIEESADEPDYATPGGSPEETLESAVKALTASVAAELQETVLKASPAFFESLVLDLLHSMGYGASRSDLQQVGGTADGGIDGIISLDRLGFEKVYVQAKRWQGSVGRPEVQAFYGALAGQHARKGVFITTSHFTGQALDYAKSVEGLVLVSGKRLAELMIEHAVGVSHRAVKIPRVDLDYFEE